jgi:hypothetical protein
MRRRNSRTQTKSVASMPYSQFIREYAQHNASSMQWARYAVKPPYHLPRVFAAHSLERKRCGASEQLTGSLQIAGRKV